MYAIHTRYTLRDSQLITLSFKSMHFQIFGKNYCRKTIEATTVKNVPNERKLIYAKYNFIVASWCPLFLYGNHLNTTTNSNGNFFGEVNLAPIGIVIF